MELFNLGDQHFFKNMYKTNIESINVNQKIYVPMLAPILTLEEAASYEIDKPLRFKYLEEEIKST